LSNSTINHFLFPTFKKANRQWVRLSVGDVPSTLCTQPAGDNESMPMRQNGGSGRRDKETIATLFLQKASSMVELLFSAGGGGWDE
jgi:hypothetical protein